MKISTTKLVFTSLLGALFMSVMISCANTTLGRPINMFNKQDIIKGRTTKEEVVKLFGAPYRTNNLGDREILTYKHLAEKGVYQELIVTIENDVVSTFSYK